MKKNRTDIDALKGIAIVAVVLFHMGLLKSGYLGVDVFFVINGFLVIPSIVNNIQNSHFSFFSFIKKRIIRLLPLIVLASMVVLVMGYFLMLPDHYENLAQSIIAANLMSENILSAITTRNYWDVVNEYKPLMHLWYVGILFEFYIVMPVFMLMANKCAKVLKHDSKTWIVSTLTVLTACSLVLYLIPIGSTGDKFYYLQYRFFELGIGGLIAIYVSNIRLSDKYGFAHKISSIALIAVIGCSLYNVIIGNGVTEGVVIGKELSTSNGLPFSSTLALLLTVALSAIVVAFKNNGSIILKSRTLAWLGKMSYSIFIWHQVLLAFYRYSISQSMSLTTVMSFFTVTLFVSVLSYYFIEKKITATHFSFAGWTISAILVLTPSEYIFLHAGVVRDIPELEVVKGTEHRGMFSEYCDRVYSYKEYPKEDNGKPNVLVEGVSFGRDFANIILESEYKDSVNLVYAYTWDDSNIIEKIKKSDYIFVFSSKAQVPSKVWNNVKETCVIKGISTKNYGSCNGIIYKNRSKDSYFEQVGDIEKGYIELNKEWKSQWEDDYIDLLTPSLVDKTHVKVFTDDKQYISQDCRHLTQAGAQWYARILNWPKIFK